MHHDYEQSLCWFWSLYFRDLIQGVQGVGSDVLCQLASTKRTHTTCKQAVSVRRGTMMEIAFGWIHFAISNNLDPCSAILISSTSVTLLCILKQLMFLERCCHTACFSDIMSLVQNCKKLDNSGQAAHSFWCASGNILPPHNSLLSLTVIPRLSVYSRKPHLSEDSHNKHSCDW